MRTYDFFSVTKPLTANAETVTFSGTDCRPDRCVELHICLANASGASGHTVNRISRVKIWAGSTQIINATLAQIRVLQQRMGWSNTPIATTAGVLTIPFSLLDAPTIEQGDVCQFPSGVNMTVELTLAASGGSGSGTAMLAYTYTDVKPVVFPTYYAQAMNVPASTLQQYPLSDGGEIRGFAMSVVGINRLRWVIAGRQFLQLSGDTFSPCAVDLLGYSQNLYDGTTITTSRYFSAPWGTSVVSGASFLELDTGSTWGGATTEIALHTVHDLGQLR